MNRRDFIILGGIACLGALFRKSTENKIANHSIENSDIAGKAVTYAREDHEHGFTGGGNQSDGDLEVFSGDLFITRDVNFNRLTMHPGARLISNGHRIYVKKWVRL